MHTKKIKICLGKVGREKQQWSQVQKREVVFQNVYLRAKISDLL